MITMLNKQQLRGILPILWTKNELKIKKTYEFDLDKLSDDKYKKLETYVTNCINENKNKSIIINKKENSNIKKNGNINNNGIYKNNNINNNFQNSTKKEEKKVKNYSSDSDSLSSDSSF